MKRRNKNTITNIDNRNYEINLINVKIHIETLRVNLKIPVYLTINLSIVALVLQPGVIY